MLNEVIDIANTPLGTNDNIAINAGDCLFEVARITVCWFHFFL